MTDITRWWWVRHAPVVGFDGRFYGGADVDCDVSDTASFENLARSKQHIWFLAQHAQWGARQSARFVLFHPTSVFLCYSHALAFLQRQRFCVAPMATA